MIKQAKVLVAGSASVTGINVIRGLQKAFIQVIGCDYQRANPANKFCDNLVVPKASEQHYVEVVQNIVETYGVTHIIPSNDHDLRTLTENKERWNNLGVLLNGDSVHTLGFLDKGKTQKLFEEARVLTPSSLEDPFDYPYVLRKKNMGSNQKFVYIVRNNSDRESLPDRAFSEGIMTRWIEGEEYTVDVLCDNSSNVLVAVPRRRIVVQQGMVHHACTVNEQSLLGHIREICRTLRIKGINCIQCIYSRQDLKYYFIEVNPRPGSGIDLSIQAGANMPALWVRNTLGESCHIEEPVWNLHLIRYYDGYFYKE